MKYVIARVLGWGGSGQGAHGIPSRQDRRRLFLENAKNIVGTKLFVYHDFEDELSEPVCRHQQVAAMVDVWAVGIFHSPLCHLAALKVKQETRQHGCLHLVSAL